MELGTSPKEPLIFMKRKTVSLCIIARDEEAYIGRAIKSTLALVDEIIVVDTGSQDNTRIIAEGYGARVVDLPWCDDFAAARNAGLEAATSDWILVLDCDEHLQSIRPVEFQRLLADPGVAGYRVTVLGAPERRPSVFPHIRLFRNEPDIRYRYAVYDQVAPSVAAHARDTGLVVSASPLCVVHDAGGAEARSRKRDRNLRLLRQAVQEHTGEPYFEYQLGSETLMRLDAGVLPIAGLAGSVGYLESAWKKVSALPPEMRRLVPYGQVLATDLAAAQLALGRPDQAAATVASANEYWGGGPYLDLQGVRAALALANRTAPGAGRQQFLDAASRRLEILEVAGAGLDAGRTLDLALCCCRGDLALAGGHVAAAAEFYEHALVLDQDHATAWLGLAECARLAGDRKRALRLYLRAVTASEWCVEAWRRGCSLMDELGFHDNAASWRAKVAEHFPECPTEAGVPGPDAAVPSG
jgi:tetratricopeptide (TPR) repeat protein